MLSCNRFNNEVLFGVFSAGGSNESFQTLDVPKGSTEEAKRPCYWIKRAI
jgi:hypothetical protein